MRKLMMAAIAAVAVTTGVSVAVEARAQPAYRAPVMHGPVDLGPRVVVREVGVDGVYEGVWTRRGASNVYDGVWIFAPTGAQTRDVVTVYGVVDGTLIATRPGGAYAFPVRRSGGFGRGRASWVMDPEFYVEIVDRRR